MNERPRAAACMTRTVYWHDQDRIYQDGQTLHYVGASPGTNRERLVREVDTEPRLSIGWGVQLIDREAAREVGFFNPAYPMGWGDDGELNHKLHLYGYECYHVPKSVVLHKRDIGLEALPGHHPEPACASYWRCTSCAPFCCRCPHSFCTRFPWWAF
jgi:hypothetical protein